jgi:hypothetical protein
MKNGTIQEKQEAVKKSIEKEKILQTEQKQQRQKSPEQRKGRGMGM